jgi:hypothetical protein
MNPRKRAAITIPPLSSAKASQSRFGQHDIQPAGALCRAEWRKFMSSDPDWRDFVAPTDRRASFKELTKSAGSRLRALRRWVQIALKPASKTLGLHGVFIRGKGLKYLIADSAFKRMQVDAPGRVLARC